MSRKNKYSDSGVLHKAENRNGFFNELQDMWILLISKKKWFTLQHATNERRGITICPEWITFRALAKWFLYFRWRQLRYSIVGTTSYKIVMTSLSIICDGAFLWRHAWPLCKQWNNCFNAQYELLEMSPVSMPWFVLHHNIQGNRIVSHYVGKSAS